MRDPGAGSVSSPAIVFFFQAEDGIRDGTVTGVQTCALPISRSLPPRGSTWTNWPENLSPRTSRTTAGGRSPCTCRPDRKSTRLNSSHSSISYAVFCLKKKKKKTHTTKHNYIKQYY